jgi:hypothetical protein
MTAATYIRKRIGHQAKRMTDDSALWDSVEWIGQKELLFRVTTAQVGGLVAQDEK